MKVSDIGEFKLIERLTSQAPQTSTPQSLGIGDDAAVISKDDSTDLVYTTDLLIEDTHFRRDSISAHDLGFKALAVNLSDIAAMGGSPRYCFLSLGLPANLNIEWMDEFAHGFYELAKKYSVALMGGDTTRSAAGIVINVLVAGDIEKGRSRLRSMARKGDKVAVTGFLGDSAAGLRLLEEGLLDSKDPEVFTLIQAHQKPLPHVPEGLWLAQQDNVHAMMDVSDGIHSDLHRIMERANVGMQIDIDRLPTSDDLKSVAQKYQWDLNSLAAAGGEDYCLLLTFKPDDQTRLQESFKKRFNRNLFVIGEVSNEVGVVRYHHSGNDSDWQPSQSFQHFS